MRLFTASLATEFNSFSPIPTNRAELRGRRSTIRRAASGRPAPHHGAALTSRAARARQEGFELIEGSCFWAEPSGPTQQADLRGMRDEILGQLPAALPVDGVLLGLHGAMVAYGYDDCEGDLIERVRAIVGREGAVSRSSSTRTAT